MAAVITTVPTSTTASSYSSTSSQEYASDAASSRTSVAPRTSWLQYVGKASSFWGPWGAMWPMDWPNFDNLESALIRFLLENWTKLDHMSSDQDFGSFAKAIVGGWMTTLVVPSPSRYYLARAYWNYIEELTFPGFIEAHVAFSRSCGKLSFQQALEQVRQRNLEARLATIKQEHEKEKEERRRFELRQADRREWMRRHEHNDPDLTFHYTVDPNESETDEQAMEYSIGLYVTSRERMRDRGAPTFITRDKARSPRWLARSKQWSENKPREVAVQARRAIATVEEQFAACAEGAIVGERRERKRSRKMLEAEADAGEEKTQCLPRKKTKMGKSVA